MTRKPLDPNLASILDSIRETVGSTQPAPAAEPDPDDEIEALADDDAATAQPAPAAARPARARKGAAAAATAPAAVAAAPAGRTVEDFLAELIRPQVKAWLDANLPEIIQKMAAEEIARLTGKK